MKNSLLSIITKYLSVIFIFINLFTNAQKNRHYVNFDIKPSLTTPLNSELNKSNIYKYSTNFNFTILHEFNKRKLYFEYGLNYYNRGYSYSTDVINLNGDKFGVYQTVLQKNYIGFPLKLGLRINKVFICLGPSFEYLISEKLIQKGKVINSNFTSKRYLLSTTIEFGTNIEPRLMRSFLISIGGYANISINPQYFSAGFKLGIKYRLKKRHKHYHR